MVTLFMHGVAKIRKSRVTEKHKSRKLKMCHNILSIHFLGIEHLAKFADI